ncbi:ABC transporter permease [Spiractinospora alimapuensis]|uniref:ABC transporter permease n=1 Tax=Spiractinospora alimapuensis TaxID=2820884 RepID=UPI001F38BBD4|nr:ABC transporter permease [Spiractinospora alimapuensis]
MSPTASQDHPSDTDRDASAPSAPEDAVTHALPRPDPPDGAPPDRVEPDAPARRRRSGTPTWHRWVSPLGLLVVWQVGSALGLIPERLLPAPTTIAVTGWELLGDGTLLPAIAVSLQRVVVGFSVGASAALVFALLAGLNRWGENLLDPPLQMLRTLPIFGLIPLFILWFGIGELPKVALVCIAVVIPLYINTFAGIRGVDPKYVEVARIAGLRRTGVIRHVIFPGALPNLLVGLRLSLGAAWLALIVAEQINADAGLGFMINSAREFLRTDIVVLGLIVYSLLGLATDALVRLLERRALVWRRGLDL